MLTIANDFIELHITPEAHSRLLNEVESAYTEMEKQNQEKINAYFRFGVAGGGCNGFKYEVLIDTEEERTANDCHFTIEGLDILIDPITAIYTKGATVDFKVTDFRTEITIDNPNAVATCSCGTSFSV
ncbi:HesB/IscA family protein [Vibrio breoganii]